MSAWVKVEREDVHVIFMRADADTSPAIQRAWAEFETAVGLKGRKFFGAFYDETGEYRVCTQLKEGDDPKALGFELGTLPGGPYLRARLQGEPPAIYNRIQPTFEEMAKQATVDAARPSIEFYRSRDVIDLLLPVR
jgi:DNA gyrase inhibitor GyrI